MKKIRIYKSGIHLGEEKIIAGNDCSGMIYFSGCHLSCKHCYTPEIAFSDLGHEVGPTELYEHIEQLVNRGAKNISFISPFHVWSTLREPLQQIRKQFPRLPILLNSSGYEPTSWVDEITEIATLWVPDFKAYGQSAAQTIHLPTTYGSLVEKSLARAIRVWPDPVFIDDKMVSGTLVRHLLMPGFFEDSLKVIQALGRIGYRSYLNFMTYFIDPSTRRIHNANPSEVTLLTNEAIGHGISVLVNGKTQQLAERQTWAI